MAKKALVVWGGWLGHEPEQIAEIYERELKKEGFEVEVSDTLESLEDVEKLKALHLIAPAWTMGEISREQVAAVSAAVANGTGIAGCHGGMCDSFRTSVQWQFITGGNWVAHPGGDGVEYVVNVKQSSSPLVAGINDFKVSSEQYYLHVDPAVEVLATTRFPTVTWYHSPNGAVDMPVVWTKRWGLGRVYYNSLGHHADIFDIPEALELMRRGLVWAAEGKDIAIEQGLDASIYESDKKMF
jgi:type 1 glutamine amidotransferase